MPPNYHGIALLLSLGTLPLACSKDSNESDDGTTSNTTTGTDTTGATDTTMASDATVTTGTQPTGTTTDDGTTTTTTGVEDSDTNTTTPSPTTFLTTDTAGDTEGDTFGDTEDLPPPTDPVCIAYAAHKVECIPRYADSREYLAQMCEYTKSYGLQTDGQPCADAINAVYVCFSKLDCAALMEEDPANCGTELQAFQTACPSQTDGDTDSDTGNDTGNDTNSSTG